jgi:hypothetical protein
VNAAWLRRNTARGRYEIDRQLATTVDAEDTEVKSERKRDCSSVRGSIGRNSAGRCAARCVSGSVRSESLRLGVSVAKPRGRDRSVTRIILESSCSSSICVLVMAFRDLNRSLTRASLTDRLGDVPTETPVKNLRIRSVYRLTNRDRRPTFFIAARAGRGQASSLVRECEADRSAIRDASSKENASQRCRAKRIRILGNEEHAGLEW